VVVYTAPSLVGQSAVSTLRVAGMSHDGVTVGPDDVVVAILEDVVVTGAGVGELAAVDVVAHTVVLPGSTCQNWTCHFSMTV
jgi:hypothetical protein